MTDLLKHGVIIACYFSLYGLELDLCLQSLLSHVTRQMYAQTDLSALHSLKNSCVWIFIELRGNEFSLLCGECSASRLLEQTLWLAEAYRWLHLGQSHTKVWLVTRWLGFQFAFLPIEAARVFLAGSGVCVRRGWLCFSRLLCSLTRSLRVHPREFYTK